MKHLLFLLLLVSINAYSQKNESLSFYVASDGYKYKIGDTIKVNRCGEGRFYFTSIWVGNFYFAPQGFANTQFIITDIVNQKIGKQSSIVFKAAIPNSRMLESLEIESAIRSNEIIPKGITEQSALNDLINARQKLDLGLITVDDYNLLKDKLAPYIK